MKGRQDCMKQLKITLKDMNLFEALSAAGYIRRINTAPERIAAVGQDDMHDNDRIVFCKDDRIYRLMGCMGTYYLMRDVTNELKGVKLK